MITYTELRRLSLDFRRLSSNFLNSTDDTAATMIQRFKKYIDDTPFISGIISDAIGEVDYDWQNCFRQSKHSGWHEIEVPVDEACHVKAMYDYLNYIISNGSNILGIAMHYPHSQKKFNEIIQHFLDIAFKPLIDFINDAICKEMILMEEQKPLGVTQNIGTVYGTVNQQGGGTINSETTVLAGNLDQIAEIEKMIEKICLDVNGTTEVKVGDNIINFKAPYKRVTMLGAIKEHTGYDLTGMNEEQIREVCKKLNMEIDDTMGKGKLIDEIFGEFCEGTYIQPTFITDYPVEMSPLTKMHRSKPGLTERFELMVNGKELANAYSELNDPLDQEERFKEQMRLADKGDDEAMIIDQDFLRALQYGMPPTSGIGIGIDRLVMLMTGQTTIQEVLFFPQMRPEKVVKKDAASKYMELGIAEDWVPVIQKAGYNTVEEMKDVNPQKLHQDICGINKKYKLELNNPSVNDVTEWINKLK